MSLDESKKTSNSPKFSKNEKPSKSFPKKDSKDKKGSTQFIGELALKRGLLSLDQLRNCLEEQKNNRANGLEKSFVEVLQDKNFLNVEELEFLEQELVIQNPQKDLIVNFEILGKLGMGAMGVVYKARDVLGEIVALKVLLPKYSNDEKFYKRFMREGFIATTLSHPNIVKAYEVGISDQYVYFSMDYVEGESVSDVLDREYSIPSKRALFIVKEIAKALLCAEENHLVHRDIKPENIMITKTGEVKLCDLGIAKEVQAQKPTFTPTDKIMGTPYYVSPELVQGNVEIDIRSDIYSLGVSFYHMVVGAVPFEGETAPRIMVKHVLETALPPKQRRPAISQNISDLIMKMMNKDLHLRIQNPKELLKEVSQINLSGEK